MWVRKKNEIPNGTIHREATCHAEERKTKDDRRKEEGQRVDFWSNQCGTGSVMVARMYSVQIKWTRMQFWTLVLVTRWEEFWVNSLEGF